MSEIVLIHGGGVGAWMWRPVLRELGEGIPVLTPSFAGHRADDPSHYDGPVAAAEDVAREIGIEQRDDLIVVGFSAGGQVALELAARHPERISSLALVSTLVEPMPGRGLVVALGALTAPLARHAGFARKQAAAMGVPAEDVEAYVAGSLAFSPESLRRLLRTNLDYRPQSAVTLHPRPMLLMAGSHEQRVVRAGLRRLAAAAPDARYVEVPGAHHDIPLRSPAALAEELRKLTAQAD